MFKERFIEALKNSGYTQTEIANKIHVSKQCITDYKKGKTVPSVDTLILLCKLLDVSADYLLGLSDG